MLSASCDKWFDSSNYEAGVAQSRYNFIHILPFINGFSDRI